MKLSDHKTKITGVLLTFVSALQANSQLMQSALSPKQFALFTAVIGALVTALGFANSAKSDDEDSK